MREPRPLAPSLVRVAAVAEALGELREAIAFIGGAIAPLLQTDPPFPRARPTKDVDAVVATTSYVDLHRLHQTLRGRAFRQDLGQTAHVHRWYAPDGTPFDLIPAGAHLGRSGQHWDQITLDTAVTTELRPGLAVRHASAPAFLALKWAAYQDRGQDDPFRSHDLEDLLALVASRGSIAAEVVTAPDVLRSYVAAQVKAFLVHPDGEDLLAGHLNNAAEPAVVITAVRARLVEITSATP